MGNFQSEITAQQLSCLETIQQESDAAKTCREAGATPPFREIAARVPAGFEGHSRLLFPGFAARVLAA
jgi:hypothetical protein